MTTPATLDTGVLVIGAGPTGAAAAWRLATGGQVVTVADRGGWFDYAGTGRDAPDWERRRATVLNPNPNLRRAPDDYPVDDASSPVKPMLANAVGGSSIHWSAHVPRFRPEDFRMRMLDGVGDDWPIGYDDLAPWYALNERRLGVARMPGDPSAPADQEGAEHRLPTVGAHGRRFAAAFDRLGWHWWPVDLVVGRDADEPGTEHCTHIGPCDLGCPSRIRSAADSAYMHDAIAAGVQLLTHTRVLRLRAGPDGRVTGAECMTPDGKLLIRADTFVLAANGMGTPLLLLRSGLANRSGLVGRRLMLHPYGRADGLFDEPVGGWVRGEKAGIVSFEFYATRTGRPFVRGVKLQLGAGPPAAAVARGTVTGRPLPWGAGHHHAFARYFDHLCGFTVSADDLPEEHNRIELSPNLSNADGLPAPAMVYRVSGNSRRALDFGLDRAEEVLREGGARETFRTPLRSQAGFHLMGTACMGNDPARSVVDRFGRCHDVPNLHIADASVFVTAASLNPTATAQALALRAADHILGRVS